MFIFLQNHHLRQIKADYNLYNQFGSCRLVIEDKTRKKILIHDYYLILLLRKDEILFSTRFSTTFSTIFSTIFENIKISILVPFWATIDHKINFTQNTSHSSFISKKKLLSVADAFKNTHFLPHFY